MNPLKYTEITTCVCLMCRIIRRYRKKEKHYAFSGGSCCKRCYTVMVIADERERVGAYHGREAVCVKSPHTLDPKGDS